MGDERPSVYAEGDKVVYRASALGGSIHALSACRMGFDPLPWPERTLQYFDEGNLHEPHILKRLREEMAVRVDGQQSLVELPIGNHIVIRGAMDGLALPLDQSTAKFFVEAKAVSQDVFDRYEREGPFKSNYRYAVQFSVYHYGCGLPGVFVYKNRNTGDMRILEYAEPPVDLPTIRSIPVRIEAAARKGDLLSEEQYRCSDYPCRWVYLHAEKTEQVVEHELLDTLAASYDRARDREQAAASSKKELKARLLEVLGENMTVNTKLWTVKRVEQNRRQFDSRKAEAEIPEIVAKYTTSKIIEQIHVKSATGD